MSNKGMGRLYRDGDVIVKQGEIGDCMFAIQAGSVEVVHQSEDGEVQVAVLQQGAIFGEMAILDKEVRSATVRAIGEARVLTIDKKTFLRRVQEDPSLAFNLTRMLCARVRRLTAEIASLHNSLAERGTAGSPATPPGAASSDPGVLRRKATERGVTTEERDRSRSDTVHKRTAAAGGHRAPQHVLASVLRRPAQEAKNAPCSAACVAGGDVRGWIGIVAQRSKLGLSDHQAYARAWNIIGSVNPFPATLGRICPHPCERDCNRAATDGAVAVNALERFLGDWALDNGLRLPTLDEGPHPESIGVIGAGPAGMSFAYQMARRGYRVTVYEKEKKAGGMLQHGIPEYRLPEKVLAREIARLAEIGIEFQLETTVGRDIAVNELRTRHAEVFLGIGATRGLRLGIPGENGPGVWTGVEYLAACNRGEAITLGNTVVVVGGGNTAIDAARTARRAGARVTLLYRRSAPEMPAIASEVAEALAEGVVIEFLASPLSIQRAGAVVTGVLAQRMQLGEKDASGRHRPIPREGSDFMVAADSVIAAVSQAPDWIQLGVAPVTSESPTFAGGDALGLGVAGLAIAQGRRAAEQLHAKLRGLEPPPPSPPRIGEAPRVDPDYYGPSKPIVESKLSVAARLADLDSEVTATITEEQFGTEAQRCFSCGLCFGCEYCYMFCSSGGFARLAQPAPGSYFALSLDRCEGCGKCIEVCPCGYLGAVRFGDCATS